MNVHNSTVKPGLCIGCGICDLACSSGAIKIGLNKYDEFIPKIDPDKCIDCSKCSGSCPNTEQKINEEALKINRSEDPYEFGIKDRDGFTAFSNLKSGRKRSSSGGFTTSFLEDLIKRKEIAGVIHAERIMNSTGSPHYRASISSTLKEIDRKRSSFYSALCFSDVLRKLKSRKKGRYVFIGTPCVIRGYKGFLKNHPDFKGFKFIYIALTCSHNVNNQFTDFLAASLNIPEEIEFFCNLRNKDKIVDADNFNNHFFNNDGDIVKVNRFRSGFTKFWRNYYFSMNVCHYCSDFWGYEADVSVKDAWGKWSVDPLGKNIVVFRNTELLKCSRDNKSIVLEKISFEELKYSQPQTVKYKQSASSERINGAKLSIANIRSGFLKYSVLSRISKYSFKKFGYGFSVFLLSFVHGMFDRFFYNRYSLKGVVSGSIGIIKKLIKIILFPLILIAGKFRHYKKFKNLKKEKKILILGGYGYGNAGDEAQLAESLKILEINFPDHILKVLTPDEKFTHFYHNRINVGKAPRTAFFDQDISELYNLNSRIKKLRFLFRSMIIILNTHLTRADLPSLFLRNRRVSLLNELKTASLVYYSGGGYLTGKTLSRLWDGMVFIRAASIFGVPVFLSGQTIGVWGSLLNRMISKWGLSKADCITLRDPEYSLNDLSRIRIKGENIFITHDDALFCERIRGKSRINGILKMTGLNNADIKKGFITVQFHFWNITALRDKLELLDKIRSILDIHFSMFKKKVIFIAMTPPDEEAIDTYMKRFSDHGILRLRAFYDFRIIRGIIAESDLCITMKHHPIIFAVGEQTPVISLSSGNYYEHKNIGALKLFGLEDFNIRIDQKNYLKQINRIFKHIKKRKYQFEGIDKTFAYMKNQKLKFIQIIKDEIL